MSQLPVAAERVIAGLTGFGAVDGEPVDAGQGVRCVCRAEVDLTGVGVVVWSRCPFGRPVVEVAPAAAVDEDGPERMVGERVHPQHPPRAVQPRREWESRASGALPLRGCTLHVFSVAVPS